MFSKLSSSKSAKVETLIIDENSQNIDIVVEETQTGSFNLGFSIGTLDGASFISGLKENNINVFLIGESLMKGDFFAT